MDSEFSTVSNFATQSISVNYFQYFIKYKQLHLFSPTKLFYNLAKKKEVCPNLCTYALSYAIL